MESKLARRNEEIERIVEKLQQERQKLSRPLSNEQAEAVHQLEKERDALVKNMETATNVMERRNAEEPFLNAHKRLLRSYGLTPCAAADCTKWLTGKQRKYCSESCKSKDKSRRWRAINPEKKSLANLQYLIDVTPEKAVKNSLARKSEKKRK